MTTRIYTWEECGLQLEVQALRWRITVRSDCPADVRQALAAAPSSGPASDLAEATERGLIALGRVEGWALARRHPEQFSLMLAQRTEDLGQVATAFLEAAYLALTAGWDTVAAALVSRGSDLLRRAGLRPMALRAATELVDSTAAELRRRKLA